MNEELEFKRANPNVMKKGSTKTLKRNESAKLKKIEELNLVEYFKLSKVDLNRLGSLRERQARRKGNTPKLESMEAFSDIDEGYGRVWCADSCELEGKTLGKERFATVCVEDRTGRMKVAFKRQCDAPETLNVF